MRMHIPRHCPVVVPPGKGVRAVAYRSYASPFGNKKAHGSLLKVQEEFR